MELLGVIGNPIAHSLSPLMHNAAFKALKRDCNYQSILVEEAKLKDVIYQAQARGFTGLNVTIPFKEKVLPYLTDLTPVAKQVESVNTILFHDQEIIGHSTDGLGFIAAAESELALDFNQKQVLVVGAGGSARSIVAQLLENQAQVYITNRTLKRAENLLSLATKQQLKPIVIPLDYRELAQQIDKIDVIINTTSVGMDCSGNATPVSPALFRPHHIVIDIIYNPQETLFLKEAKSRGCKTQNGIGMLVWQAAKAWEFWWGYLPPIDIMYQAVTASLKT